MPTAGERPRTTGQRCVGCGQRPNRVLRARTTISEFFFFKVRGASGLLGSVPLVPEGAEANDMDAQTNLGYMYDQGLGCGRSVNTAASWYRKATERGNPLGQNNLADMYFKGEGVRQDNARHSAGSRKPSHRDTLARASSWDPCTPRAWGRRKIRRLRTPGSFPRRSGAIRQDENRCRSSKVFSARNRFPRRGNEHSTCRRKKENTSRQERLHGRALQWCSGGSGVSGLPAARRRLCSTTSIGRPCQRWPA